ncbi:MAG: hypothetical protein GXO18_08330 [Aquificae bacterium]|nr:hypothetical protein [Aquificota bacterium]
MAMSQEFQLGINLIERFKDTLSAISEASSPEEAKPLIESIKHPIFGAMAQIKVGEGPLKEEILEPLGVVVSQFRELTDFEALKEAIPQVLNLVEQSKKMAEEGAQQKG